MNAEERTICSKERNNMSDRGGGGINNKYNYDFVIDNNFDKT